MASLSAFGVIRPRAKYKNTWTNSSNANTWLLQCQRHFDISRSTNLGKNFPNQKSSISRSLEFPEFSAGPGFFSGKVIPVVSRKDPIPSKKLIFWKQTIVGFFVSVRFSFQTDLELERAKARAWKKLVAKKAFTHYCPSQFHPKPVGFKKAWIR